jgi:hypothetical protein
MGQIDFTSGYRDAAKGSTIKALQQRRAEQQAAIESAMQPRQIASPWQGAAQMADVIGGSIREARASNQEAAARDQFAKLLAGGLTPDEIGQAMQLDPEITMKYQEHTWDTEAKKAEQDALNVRELQKHGWDVDAATARVQAERDAATQAQGATMEQQKQGQGFTAAQQEDTQAEARLKAQQDVIAKADADAQAAKVAEGVAAKAAEVEAAKPKDELGQAAADFRNGLISKEDYEARKAKIVNIAPANVASTFTPGQAELDKKAADDVSEWKTTGGANATKAISSVQNAIGIMQKDPSATGLMTAVREGVLPQAVANWWNPNTTVARAAMRETVQSTLRATLGAQFTEKEGVDLMNRAFDPSLPVAVNIQRAQAILEQVTQVAANRQEMADYFDKNGGTIRGYTPKGMDIEAIKAKTAALFQPQAPGGDTTGNPNESDENFVKRITTKGQ